jgi:hypothetical protein
MHTRLSRLPWRKQLRRLFIFCLLTIPLSVQATSPGSNFQQVKPGAVPIGLSASDWAEIQSTMQVPEEFSAPGNAVELTAGLPLSELGFLEQNYLKASNTERDDRFGWAVAMDGDTLAVSAIWEDSSSAGVDGDQADRNARQSGAVYVFTLGPMGWSQQAYLKASNPDPEDYFGYKLALSGETLAVGAVRERSGNGDQADNSSITSGAVYVFTRTEDTWSQQSYLKASNIGQFDAFGWSVDLDGDTLVVGAIEEDGSATGVNGIANDSAANAGAAYVFIRSGETWTQQAYLKASNTEAGDQFGNAVAISGETIVIGATGEDSSATGVDGSQGNNSAADAGAVYIFTRTGETWTQQAYLKASNPDPVDSFGQAVAIEADTLVVGAHYEDSKLGDESNNQYTQSGAAYIFDRSGETWSQSAFLKASNAQKSDRFGYSVDISGDMLIVGAYGEASNATGVDGNQSNNSIPNAGAVYVFSKREAVWNQKAYLKQFPSGQGQDGFSDSLAIFGGTVLVGADSENSNATGVDGDQTNILAIAAGAAYVFKTDVFLRNSFE